MRELFLIGIGTGNPDHLTAQAAKAINGADLILLPRKGPDKADLADLRRGILATILTNPATRVVEFDLPVRDAANPDYLAGVDDWHRAIALAWARAADVPDAVKVALLVWGDPSLYDSTLRIAARLPDPPRISVIPGITAIQALAAAHAIALNAIGAPFMVTTGRRLRETGFPPGCDTCVVMLDGECSFQSLAPEGMTIWWGAYLGMAAQIIACGPLAEAGPRIVATRASARARHGWIMDIYLLRRDG
jgi:precorrin-6A synthase